MKKQIMTRLLNGAIFVTLLAALTQTASATPHPVAPDAGSTMALMSLACAGLVAVRRLLR